MKGKGKFAIAAFIGTLILLILGIQIVGDIWRASGLREHSVSLGEVSDQMITKTITVSPDNNHIAYVVSQGKRAVLIVDGIAGKMVDLIAREDVALTTVARDSAGKEIMALRPRIVEVRSPYIVFSRDSKRQVRIETNEGKWVATIDGARGAEYDEIREVTFSRDSRRLAYIAGKGQKECVVVDGIPGREYDRIRGLIFSNDGSKFAYIGIRMRDSQRVDKYCLVVQGMDTIEYDGTVRFLTVSPNGGRIAFSLDDRSSDKRFVVVDGVKRGECVNAPVFSPDGGHVAWVSRKGSKYYVTVDGISEERGYDKIDYGPRFLARGKTVVYAAVRDDSFFLIVGKKEVTRFDSIECLVLGPNYTRFACVVNRKNKKLVVIDGIEGPTYDNIGKTVGGVFPDHIRSLDGGLPTFSPDGGRIAYSGKRDDKWFAVLEGVELGECATSLTRKSYTGPFGETVYEWYIAFSPDSRHVAYVAQRGPKNFVVLDGKDGKEYDRVKFISFSPDSRHVAYVAKREGKWVIVVDGIETSQFDEFLGTKLVFSSPTTLHGLIKRQNQILRLEVSAPRTATNGGSLRDL